MVGNGQGFAFAATQRHQPKRNCQAVTQSPLLNAVAVLITKLKFKNMNTYFLEEKFIRKIDKDYNYEAKKTALIAVINMMDERDCEKLYMEINELVQFRDANVGKWAFDKKEEPCSLLHRFWQRSSDACPLEASEAEKQEDEFNDWVCEQYEQLSFPV